MNELPWKSYEIWSEGYVATGEYSRAHYFGVGYGHTFQEACDRFFVGDKNYDEKRLTYWGCHLFDNEIDARESFG